MTNAALQGEGGEFVPILPAEELEALYDRIVAEELTVADGSGGVVNADGTPVSGRVAATLQQGRAPLNARLAAALGLTQLLLPFRLAPSLQADICWQQDVRGGSTLVINDDVLVCVDINWVRWVLPPRTIPSFSAQNSKKGCGCCCC